MLKPLVLAVAVALPVLAQINSAPPTKPLPPPPAGVTMQSEVVMGQGGGRDLHADIAYPAAPTPSPMPAIIFVHGGGWSKGHYGDFLPLAYTFAQAGYFTATIEYRLSGEAKWPAQIEDCKLGVRWLRANAAKYHVDPNKIGALGHSAGGHLVACLGTMDDPKFDVGDYPGVSSRVQAVSDWSGPTTFIDPNAVTARSRARGMEAVTEFIGFTHEQRPDLWKEASPITWIKSDDPPFQVVHGDHDQNVSLVQGTGFAAALKKAGVPTELIIVKNGTHNLIPAKGGPPAVPNHRELMAQVFAFFDRHLKGK